MGLAGLEIAERRTCVNLGAGAEAKKRGYNDICINWTAFIYTTMYRNQQ